MQDSNLKRIEELFQAAADLPSAEREAFLAERCDDPELRDRVRAMLRELESGESLAAPGPPFQGARITEGPGTVIDRYKLLQRLGEGGFGVVYMAEQQEPVTRKVALKIIKLGMDTREVIARFEAERQALALMDHPGISRVLDAGATAQGRPYFVMELVRGVPITTYCDENRLRTRERLELFIETCLAVQHAHQKGVIHRDIKPSNVMVTVVDDRPVAKVIDFGIAKAMHTRLTEKTLFTEYHRFIGTPAYMSPEQAELTVLDVDTRSDIYSLGVLLYELLTGTTPLDTSSLWEEGLAEVQRAIREDQPPKPSQRISTTGDATVAERRRLDVTGLTRRVRGDLDWIVLKALEKDRSRRYATAVELADDLRRHLAQEPVHAGPPSKRYRMGKFLARNKAGVASVTLVTVALIGGAIGTVLGLFEASHQRDEAVASQAATEQVTRFLVETLALTDPDVALTRDVSVRQLLDRAAAQLDENLAGQPQVEARLRTVIGRAYESLDESFVAEQHLRRAVELYDAAQAPPSPEVYSALWALTNVCFRLERLDAFAVAMRARAAAHDALRASSPDLARAFERLGRLVDDGARGPDDAWIPEARTAFAETVELSRSLGADDELWPLVEGCYMHAGFSLWYTPHELASLPFWRRAQEIQTARLPLNHPQHGETLAQIVGVLNRAGRAAEAEQELRAAIEEMRTVFPPTAFQLAYCESMLGDSLAGQGRFAEAEELLVRGHESILAGLDGKISFYAVDSFTRVIGCYAAMGREEEAQRYRDAYTAIGRDYEYPLLWPYVSVCFGPDHAELRAALESLRALTGPITYQPLDGSASAPELEAAVREAVRLRRETVDEGDPLEVVAARLLLGFATTLDPERETAARRLLLEDFLGVCERWQEPRPIELAYACTQLAAGLHAEGDLDGASALNRRGLAALAADTAEDNWFEASYKALSGAALLEQQRYSDAEPILLRAHATYLDQLGSQHVHTRSLAGRVADLYRAWGRPDDAARFDALR